MRRSEQRLRHRSRIWPIAALTAGVLLVGPFRAAGQQAPAVIGQVVNSSGATQNGVALPSGGTVFDGDVVSTGASGNAVIKLSPTSQVSLDESTSAVFSKVLDQLRLRLQKGTVVVESSDKSLMAVVTPKFEIHPALAGGCKVYVGLMADNSTYIESAQGQIVIVDTKSGKSYVLPSGQNTLVPENASGIPGLQPRQQVEAATSQLPPPTPAPQQPSARQKPAGHNTGLLIGLGVAAAAGGGVAALAGGGGGGGGGGGSPASPTVP